MFRAFQAVAILSSAISFSSITRADDIQNQDEIIEGFKEQTEDEKLVEVTRRPIDDEDPVEGEADGACGDSYMSDFYLKSIKSFREDGFDNTGWVKLKLNTVIVDTAFRDIVCLNRQVVFIFQNGGKLTITSYFGGYLPSPVGSTVDAFYGNLQVPGIALNNARYWIDTSKRLNGLLLLQAGSYFQLTSNWW